MARNTENALANTFSTGTRGIQRNTRENSLVQVPINEDWCFIGEVVSYSEGLAVVTKVWDQGTNKKEFYCAVRYEGNEETPEDGALEAGQFVRVHRVGEFNSQGTIAPELREEQASGFSFLILLGIGIQTILVMDLDGENGQQVTIDAFGQYQTPTGAPILPLKTIEPVENYYESTPPFQQGKIYRGFIQNETYYIEDQSVGELAETIEATADAVTFELDVDGSGRVLDLRAST